MAFGDNWYITCYLLFYSIHPFLNTIIHKMSRQQVFRVFATMFAIYYGFDFIRGEGMFFSTHIILWITIYFVMAYMQLHMAAFSDNLKQNLALLFAGLIGYVGVGFVANILGRRLFYLNDSVLHWASRYNPFLLIISIALFNCMRRLDFRNKIINYISSLSLLIYIIYENIILCTYYRPAMWHFIYQNYGYSYFMLWVLAMVAAVFLFALCCSILYDKTIRRVVHSISNGIYAFVRKCYLKAETIMLKLH